MRSNYIFRDNFGKMLCLSGCAHFRVGSPVLSIGLASASVETLDAKQW